MKYIHHHMGGGGEYPILHVCAQCHGLWQWKHALVELNSFCYKPSFILLVTDNKQKLVNMRTTWFAYEKQEGVHSTSKIASFEVHNIGSMKSHDVGTV